MKFKVLNNYILVQKGVMENPSSGKTFFRKLWRLYWLEGGLERTNELQNVPHSPHDRLKDSNTALTAKMLTK